MNINEIVTKLAKYPGITRRNAMKILFHLIRNKSKIQDFTKILQSIESEVQVCSSCGNVAFNTLCEICENAKRDSTIVCIVEEIEDISNLEKGGWYNGTYHVLGGLLSAQRGMMPENLNILTLIEKICADKVQEIIFASTSSFEWQATMHFLVEELKKLPKFSLITVTEFAHGLPIGSSFEYMDEGTLQVAFTARKNLLQ
ncbi:MAG: recombination protein RecR [Candidatus Deianiraeaceae bacterium]|jgi:recombination protein RecR